MNRGLDLLISAIGLTCLSPFLALVGIAVFLTSGRPVLFAQERVGLNGRPFKVLKFRTMAVRIGAESGLFEPGSQARVTPFGRILRAWKIDELPQLWNVLKDEMSFVGPRPEIRKWVDAFPDRWRKILTVKPGITDPASLYYRDEEEILSASPDPEATYRGKILPHKLDLYERYVENRTLLGDLGIILRTLDRVVR